MSAKARAALIASLPREKRDEILRAYTLRRKIRVRKSFEAYCEISLAREGLIMARHSRLIARAIQDCLDGTSEQPNLMIFAPPGHAKSKICTHLFPAWYIGQGQARHLALATYAQPLADNQARQVLNNIQSNPDLIDYGLTSRQVQHLRASNLSDMKAVGVGGGLTGFRSTCGLIDDPVKDRAEAKS